MNIITKEELLSRKNNGLTIKDLRQFVLENPQIEDQTPVLVERVSDFYFSEQGSWKVLLNEGYHYWNASQFNEKMMKEIENRKIGIKEYEKIDNPEDYMLELTDDLKEQFFTSHCITKDNDNSVVYIYNHY